MNKTEEKVQIYHNHLNTVAESNWKSNLSPQQICKEYEDYRKFFVSSHMAMFSAGQDYLGDMIIKQSNKKSIFKRFINYLYKLIK